MGILRLPGLVQTTQPQSGPITLDPGNPITRGIDVAFVDLGQPGISGVAKLTKMGAAVRVAAKYGVGWDFSASGGSFFQASGWPVLPDGTEYTILVVMQLISIGTTDSIVDGDPNPPRQFQTRIETNGAPTIIGFNTAVTTATATGTPLAVGVPQAVIFRYSSTAVSVFQKGVKTGNAAATGTIKGIDGTNITIGSRQSTTNLHGSIGLVVRWPRALSDAEAKAVTANPWQLFRSPQRVMLAGAGGATDTPINPGVGALALTGYAPSVAQSANRLLTPAAGSIGITGYAPTVTQAANQAVTPGVGSLTLSGYAPAVAQTVGQWLVPSAGSLTISGYAPTIAQPQTVAPGLGSLAITGYAPTVTQAINQSIAPGSGTLTLSGYAPSIAQSANQVAQPAAGSLSLTGYAPLVAQSVNQSIVPSVGSLTITGFAPVIVQASASPNLQPGAGMLSIVGYAPTVEQRDPSASVGGGGAGDWLATRDFADRLDKAGRALKPTKAAKKLRRKQIEEEVLELLPDLPAARLIAPVIAQAVYRKEAAAVARWTPPRAMQPVIKPNASAVDQAAELKAEALAAEFDAAEAIRAMVEQWQKNEAIALELEREAEEESEIEMLLLG